MRFPWAADGERNLLIAALLVAVTATIGSLYFSLGLKLYPCELCWYQRILTYPLVVILAVAIYEERPTVYRTVIPLASVNLALATYHSALQRVPSVPTCGAGGCEAIQHTVVGLTIPNLSALASFCILGLMTRLYLRHRNTKSR